MRENMIYDTNRYQLRESVIERMLEIVREKTIPCEYLFYGDSIIRYMPTQEYFKDSQNHGIVGISSDILLHFVDEAVIKYKPKELFIMVGTNDLGNTIMASPRDIALNVKELIEIIHFNLPNTKINVISCIPCLEEIHGYVSSNQGIRSNDVLSMIFNEYKRMIPYDFVRFIDVFDTLLDENNKPIKEYYIDGLHINEKGYEKVIQRIKEELHML